ncbi:MAG: helix-turn-helix transcriptional regulator [Proteobacteria bacterium]|nr:helix-turn-helix transcriptional regulator [Pseudomonadota bacterium]
MSQSSQIILTLKKTLKAHGIKYLDVANHLHISESSIKRQFSQGDISLHRLEKICELVGMDIADLLELVHLESMQVEQLSITQERMIVSNTKLLLVTVLVLNNLTFAEIYDLYEIDKPELIKLLLKLEKICLIQLKPDNKIKTLISRTFQWQKNGPIQRYFEEHVLDDFFDCKFSHAGELRVVINGMIASSSNQTMQKKIQQLAQNFSDLAYKDQNIGFDSRYGSTLVIAMRPWEFPEFAKYRRAKNNKVFY